MSKTGTIDLTGAFTKSLVAKLDKAESQRDQLLSAAKALQARIDLYFKSKGQAPAEWYEAVELRAAIAAAEKP